MTSHSPFLRCTSLCLLVAVLPLVAAQASSPAVVKEWFLTTEQPRENIDSPAVWHGPDGQHWLLATSKEGHSVNVFDAVNGAMIRRVGGLGSELGQFNRPNGISVVNNYLLVVERDNRRVQVLSLPDLVGLCTFGEEELRNPYGLWVRQTSPIEYQVFVTDSYETPEEKTPPPARLGERIRVYTFEGDGPIAEGELETTFGDTSGPGVLHVVESLFGDEAHNRLLIADEDEDPSRGMNIKVYDLDGKFTGRTIGDGLFTFQVEGIALYDAGGGKGWWIAADQGKRANFFHVFDRESLAHIGSFQGERTLVTDGIWLTQTPMPRLPSGAFYTSDADMRVTAFSLAEIAETLKLDLAPANP